jgi:hypothetical protein
MTYLCFSRNRSIKEDKLITKFKGIASPITLCRTLIIAIDGFGSLKIIKNLLKKLPIK